MPLEEVGQMAVALNEDSVRYVEHENKRYIFNYNIRSRTKILQNGIFVIRKRISNILYAEVSEYRKLIVYDHLNKEICLYVNDLENILKNSNTYILAVWRYPSKILDLIKKAII